MCKCDMCKYLREFETPFVMEDNENNGTIEALPVTAGLTRCNPGTERKLLLVYGVDIEWFQL